MIISANVMFVALVYSDSSPFIEKIQAFEKFFARHIDLYDKVRFPYKKATCPPLYVALLNDVFEVLVIVIIDTGARLPWSRSQLCP